MFVLGNPVSVWNIFEVLEISFIGVKNQRAVFKEKKNRKKLILSLLLFLQTFAKSFGKSQILHANCLLCWRNKQIGEKEKLY